MSTISLRPPESLSKQVRELASQEGISINQFAATAIAEKLSALMTSSYLEQRAARGNRVLFEQAMAKVGDAPPDEKDRLWECSQPDKAARIADAGEEMNE